MKRNKFYYFVLNPFNILSIGFLLVILIYTFNWSDLYLWETLRSELIYFVFLIIIFSFLIGLLVQNKINKYVDHKILFINYKYHKISYFFILLYSIEFIYFKKIPIINALLGKNYVYGDFGLPILHMFIVSTHIFYILVIFEYYLKSKKNKFLLIFILNLLLSITLLNRGMLLTIILSSTFLFIYYNIHKISIKKLMISFLILIILFGFLGNLRLGQYSNETSTNKSIILQLGNANDNFYRSQTPDFVFWTYIYIVSPLGNLNNTIKSKKIKPDLLNLVNLIKHDILLETIHKRIDFIGGKRNEAVLVNQNFNASTMFIGGYLEMGYIGMILIFLYYMLFSLIYIILIQKNIYRLVGLSILSTNIFFGIFNNIFVKSAFMLPLLLVLVLGKRYVCK